MIFIGSFLLFGDWVNAKDKGGAVIVSILAMMMVGVQAIFCIIGYFKPHGAGTGLIVTGTIVLILALLTSAYFTSFVEIIIIIAGVLLKKGKTND